MAIAQRRATTERALYSHRAVSDRMRAAVQLYDSPRPTLVATVSGGP